MQCSRQDDVYQLTLEHDTLCFICPWKLPPKSQLYHEGYGIMVMLDGEL